MSAGRVPTAGTALSAVQGIDLYNYERTSTRPVTGTLVLVVQARFLDLRLPALALESVTGCRLALRRLPAQQRDTAYLPVFARPRRSASSAKRSDQLSAAPTIAPSPL
jgi:hypothetical protein